MPSSRQLAAIMFTDIVGYTALMGKDSNKALELVRISKDIQKPLVEKHNGKWLKEMGDGAMAQFSTALDAVNCSIEIQEVARAKLDGKLRIGIHSGDITIEDDDVYGDGVNVASRLESIADPGGIYISDSIQKAIQGQTEIQARYLGEVKLKNVSYGVRTYALQGVGLPVPEINDEMKLSGHIWAEIKRRGVLRAGSAYIVVTILLILLQREAKAWITFPQWSFPVSLTILIFGFPVAMYFAWNFERSPEGLVRTSSRESWQNPYSAVGRKPFTGNFLIGILLLIILVMYAYPKYFPENGYSKRSAIAETDKSLAVLPFDNLSNDPDQDYISDGMMEAILNHLTKIEGLRVTSRTTMMTYKGSDKTTPEIASEVAVRYVLEGSVLRVENTIRITVQLIDGQRDEHIWSESYDGQLSDLLSIQSEVAQQIAGMLQVNISPAARANIEAVPTQNVEAYDLYLSAVHLRPNSGNDEEYHDLIEEAIRLDPQFALAYSELGWYWVMRAFGDRKYVLKAESTLNKALLLDPNQESAHTYLGYLNLWLKWDFLAAERELYYAQLVDPSNPYKDIYTSQGKFEEALEIANEEVRREPNNGWQLGAKAMILYFNDRADEALETLELAAKGSHIDERNYYGEMGRTYLYLQKFGKVVEVLEEGINMVPGDPRLIGTLTIAHHHLGNFERANELLLELKQLVGSQANSPSFYLAMIYAQMGEIDTAFEWLDKSYEDHEIEMYWLKVEPPFEPLHDDPRWQVMLDKVGFPD